MQPFEYFVDLRAVGDGVVSHKAKLRHMAQLQSRAELAADITLGRFQSLDRFGGLILALHRADVNGRIREIVSHFHSQHRDHAADSRVFQISEYSRKLSLYVLINAVDSVS